MSTKSRVFIIPCRLHRCPFVIKSHVKHFHMKKVIAHKSVLFEKKESHGCKWNEKCILSALTVSHANTFTQNQAKHQLFTRWIAMQFHVCRYFMRKLNDRLDDDIQSFLSVHCRFEISILGRVIPCSVLIIITIYKKFVFNVVQA